MASSEALIGPTRGTQVQTVQTMRETCRFAKENVLDQKIDTYFDFGFMNLQTTAGPALFSGVGGGVPVTSDVGASLILSLQRENTVMVPNADTVLRINDRLGLIGSPNCVEEAALLLRG